MIQVVTTISHNCGVDPQDKGVPSFMITSTLTHHELACANEQALAKVLALLLNDFLTSLPTDAIERVTTRRLVEGEPFLIF